MSDERIVLPRAAVEELRRAVPPLASDAISPYVRANLVMLIDALLAAAKPVVDAGVTQSEDGDVFEGQPSCEVVMPPGEIVTVPRRGRYRWLVIAADAAEEGK